LGPLSDKRSIWLPHVSITVVAVAPGIAGRIGLSDVTK
jgi:hypothetical protein